jgi:hypothetical protein
MTPNTLFLESIKGKSLCCMVLNAFAEAVLQASITNSQPLSKS